MTMYSVIDAVRVFLRLLSLAMFVYWILTLLRFNSRLVELLAKFIYPFVRPFRRPAMWVMRRTGWPIDFTLWFAMIGVNIVSELLLVLYARVFLPLGLY
ncbi:MAG TPA: YggT family protein [Candidatus Pullichristensenella stercorigallinarum]|uniref:YggT family protein n=1 Tax=Candidatus Pullichristensenella stercorigallinarum TaxID=2840909 RepID=A0A9D0ZN38_9FIRM|nr:YggT family protein [Candidatus Pullichristensenella stercorigallinarum]